VPPASEIVICTPYCGFDVPSGINLFTNKQEIGAMGRRLFRKVSKALGKHLAVIANQEQGIEVLKAQVDHFRQRKKESEARK
jgi:hypothetical protein